MGGLTRSFVTPAAALLCFGLLVQTIGATAACQAAPPVVEPSVVEYAHGMSRVTRAPGAPLVGGTVVYGTGIDSTLWWESTKSEAIRFTVFQPGRRNVEPEPPFYTTGTVEAREDGSELVRIDGWGSIELWPAEAKARKDWRDNAGPKKPRERWIWIQPAAEGAFDVFSCTPDLCPPSFYR